MKVIFIKDVENLGNTGDAKEVADGYARNFLIPGGFVKIATKAAVEQAEKIKIKKGEQAEKDLKSSEEIAEKLESVSIIIKAKADESGKLYAAVKPKEISKLLNDKGFKIDENKISIEEPIKELGDYEVVVNLNHGLEVKIGVVVESNK